MAWNNPYMGVGNMNPYTNNYLPQTGYSQPLQQPYSPVPVSTMPQSQQANTQPNVAIQGRMVTSKEEALGVPVDFSGTPMYFPDMSHGVIYCKKFNLGTGAADFGEFRLVQPQSQSQEQTQQSTPVPTPQFVPLEDFQALQGTVSDLQKEIERLKKPTTSSNNGKAVKKDESDGK